MALGRIERRLQRLAPSEDLRDHEFQVFSQWGEDGVIQHLVNRVPISWRHDLRAECAFVDRDNINELLGRNGVSGDIGLLSTDVDGNDCWIWEAIEQVRLRIVVGEYHTLFGPRRDSSPGRRRGA